MSCSLDKTRAELIKKGIMTNKNNLVNSDGATISKFNEYLAFIKNLATQKYGELTDAVKVPFSLNGTKVVFNQVFFDWVDKNNQPKDDENLLQLPSENNPQASPQVVKLVKELLEKIGVKYEGGVKEIVVDGVKLNANGIARITQGLVQVIDGKEAESLPEEAMHFLVELLEQKNPKLFNKLLSEVNQYDVYKEVLATYSSNSFYQTTDGKPDIRKLKKEAIAKVLVEKIIKKTDTVENGSVIQSWWNSIIEFFRNLVASSGFDKVALDVIAGKIEGDIEDLRNSTDDVFLQKNTQDQIFDKLKAISATITKKEEGTDEEKGYYIQAKKIARRVTDFAKTWYDRRFAEKSLLDTEFDKAIKDLKAEKGTAGHKDFEYAFSVLVDENGYLRDTPLPDDTYTPLLGGRATYDIIKQNLKNRLESFPKGSRFLSEIVVYDKKRDVAGTIDLVIVDPDGKVHVLDWKFVDLNIEKTNDIPWYKINAWNIQMGQYKIILKEAYGIEEKSFGQTRMIPIKIYYKQADYKKGILPKFDKIKIGDAKVENIEEDYLLPVALPEESTGNREIDKLLEKLNALYKLLSDRKVSPEERRNKAEQLNKLFTAIRQLQIKQNIAPLIEQALIINKQIDSSTKRYNELWKGKNPDDFTQREVSDFYEELEVAHIAIQQYLELDITMDFMFDKEDLSDEELELKAKLDLAVKRARKNNSAISNISKEFVEKFVAEKEGVDGILYAEKVIKGISKWWSSTATLQIKALQVLYKKANRALAHASMDTLDESKRLQELKASYDKWALSKGLINKNYFSYIKKADKNELIDEYNPKFYSTLKQKIAEKDYNWIRENVDIEAVKKASVEKIEKEIEREINKNNIIETAQERESRIKRQIENIKAQYGVTTATSIGWLMYDVVKRHPSREKWETKEWAELHKPENKPALEFFNYIKERNTAYQDIGYINAEQARVFLPFVRKGLMEKIVLGGNVKVGEEFLRSVSIDEGDIGYGKIDPLTGRPIDNIPVYFTKSIDGEISTDLFRTMALYNEMAIRYKYLSDIEAQARALVNTERNKKAIATSTFGKTVYENGELKYTPDNNDNTKLVEDMVKGIIYGQRFIQSDTFDQILGKFGSFGKTANEKLGVNWFPENLDGRQVSINKVINQLNNTFQLNALGLNPLSALSNLMGGSFQSIINAETYFTKTDFMKAEMMLTLGKMRGVDDQKKLIAALEYFLPLTDSYNKQIAKTLSLSSLSQENVQEFLMVLMRKSDFFVQTANFYAFLDNSIVVDGRVVNVREYLRNQPEFKDQMYVGTRDDRRLKKEKFESEIKRLLDEQGVLKLSKVEGDKLVIPGVNRKDESVVELRRKVQQVSKDALGNLSEDDMRAINMNIYGKSLMLFKNWIPRLVDVRLGNIKYNSASDAYEWGRQRMIFRIYSEGFFSATNKLIDALRANDEGVAYMIDLFERKREEYKKETGKELNMTEEEFMDLVRKNIRGTLIDALIMITLMLLYLGMKANIPDDEEDPAVINSYKYTLRAVDKIKDELRFFYDPTSLTSLVSSGIFPSIGYIRNLQKIVTNFGKEHFGILRAKGKDADDVYVIKYVMKAFPITRQVEGILPMFYPELAKDLGIKIQTESRPINM
jgi:hypothetical protein